MIKTVLLVSNEKPLSDTATDKLLQLVKLLQANGKGVHIFREDLSLYSVLKTNPEVKCISGLNSGSDLLLFNRKHEGVYSSEDAIGTVFTKFDDIYSKALSRHPIPERSKAFDDLEYKTLRFSIVGRRLKFIIQQVSSTYSFIINFKDSKDLNLLNSITPAYGDGKFLYTYDCSKNKGEFAVGGCFLNEADFEACIKEG